MNKNIRKIIYDKLSFNECLQLVSLYDEELYDRMKQILKKKRYTYLYDYGPKYSDRIEIRDKEILGSDEDEIIWNIFLEDDNLLYRWVDMNWYVNTEHDIIDELELLGISDEYDKIDWQGLMLQQDRGEIPWCTVGKKLRKMILEHNSKEDILRVLKKNLLNEEHLRINSGPDFRI